MKKINLKTIIILTASTLVILLAAAWLPILSSYESLVKEQYDSNSKLTNNGNPILGGFDAYEKIFRDYKIVITSYNPINPIFSIVFNFDSDNNKSDIGIFKFIRTGDFNFEEAEYININVSNKSFQEAVALAQKYDLSKENPDPANITVYKQPTAEEIKSVKKSDEVNQNPEYRAERDKCSIIKTSPENEDCIIAARKKYGLE